MAEAAQKVAEIVEIQDQIMVKEFGIEELAAANIVLMEKQILEIPEHPETKEQYDAAYRYNVDAKKLLPRIEERRKELKAPVLEKGKAIDETAKKAVSMIQPLIELSGTRRESWEAEKAAEKAEKERQEAERAAAIQAKFDILNLLAGKYQEYNRPAEKLAKDLAHLEEFEISAVDFEERTEEAEQIKVNAIEATKTALENRKKFEADQAEAIRVKAEQEAERKRLEEEAAKLEAMRLEQEEKARKAAEAEAETRRLAEEAIRAEREALEAEKAKAAHAAIVMAREAVWEVAHQENFDRDHAAAIIEHEIFLEEYWHEVEQLKNDAMARWEETEKAKEAAAARAKLIGPDKKRIQEQINLIDAAISEIKPFDFATDEAVQVVTDLYIRIKTALDDAEKAGIDLV